MSIKIGNKIIAGGAGIRGNRNPQSPLSDVYDWVGTLEEYKAQNIKTLHPEWMCYITNDNGVETIVEPVVIDQTLNNPYSLFECKYSDHILNNASWLRSVGQWNNAGLYVSAYDKLVGLLNGTEEPIRGISVKAFEDESITEYDFVVNDTDRTFRLPLKSKIAGGRGIAGNGMTLGLTDGTNFGGFSVSNDNTNPRTGNYGQPVGTASASGAMNGYTLGITPDATKSGMELVDTEDVYLYYYVGDTIQNLNVIQVDKILERLATLGGFQVIDAGKNFWVRADGYCEQWGVVSNMDSTGSGQRIITLEKAYSSKDYLIQVHWKNAGTQSPGSAWMGSVKTQNVDSFEINKDNKTYVTGYYWKTCGYLAAGQY